jgi:radical SAM protein (TIGR01212 family)
MNDIQTERMLPFKSYSRYLKQKYGGRVYRVGVDAGFSCPNRGADRSAPGCLYCDEYGSRAPYLGDTTSLDRQVSATIEFLKRRYHPTAYVLYFQAFSGTNAPVAELKRIYDHGLSLAPFKELVVSTRPDCIDEEKAALLASYSREDRDVWVELGLQSAHDATLRLLSRGHTVGDFIDAFHLLKKYRINTAVHLIFGLPGEDMDRVMETVRFIARLKPGGVKIHNLHIPHNTLLYKRYTEGEITAPSAKTHLEYVINALSYLPPETLIMRLTCDTPSGRLAAPVSFLPKQQFYSLLAREMRARGISQGDCYEDIK